MKKASPEAIDVNKAEMLEWEQEMERLQSLRPVQASRDNLKAKEIPALERQIKEQEAAMPDVSREAEEVRPRHTSTPFMILNDLGSRET